MKNFLLIIQIIVSTLLMVIILLQAKGSGLSATFGGEGGFYRSKRGVEKLFVYLTVILATLFFIISTVLVII
ncbi:preprotein translocase subunit SecG [Candidatus Curtissbacteria bacterium]|nr:preprotein translocase subunit SecG [Candidatus Curtissbacteria bacterium]